MSFNAAGAARDIWGQELVISSHNTIIPPRYAEADLTNVAQAAYDHANQIGADAVISAYMALGAAAVPLELKTIGGQLFWSEFGPSTMSDEQFVNQSLQHFGFELDGGNLVSRAELFAGLSILHFIEHSNMAAGTTTSFTAELDARGAFIGLEFAIWAEMPGHASGGLTPIVGIQV